MANYLRSKQIMHNRKTLDFYLNEIVEKDLTIKALITLLVQKEILTQDEIDNVVNSIKVMDKLTED